LGVTSDPIELLAPVMVETVDFVWANWKPSGAMTTPAVLAGFSSHVPLMLSAAQYAAARVQGDTLGQMTNRQRAVLEELADSQTLINQLKQDANKVVAAQSQVLASKASEADQKDQARHEEWSTFFQASQAQIEALKAQVHETRALQTATSVWKRKQTRHRVTFGIGLSGLALTIAALVILFLFKAPDLFGQLPRKTPDNDIPYGVVALCFVPIIAIGWILRIGAKWITNSLTLSEDAEQRRAMLDTYFSLVGDPNAKMEEKDRILILNAIFRPLPGYQTEDVAPPSLLDLVKDAVVKK
jgi:ElaB/YqjD/DUF883 family membrane-anchored ribosome-binding protein